MTLFTKENISILKMCSLLLMRKKKYQWAIVLWFFVANEIQTKHRLFSVVKQNLLFFKSWDYFLDT